MHFYKPQCFDGQMMTKGYTFQCDTGYETWLMLVGRESNIFTASSEKETKCCYPNLKATFSWL